MLIITDQNVKKLFIGTAIHERTMSSLGEKCFPFFFCVLIYSQKYISRWHLQYTGESSNPREYVRHFFEWWMMYDLNCNSCSNLCKCIARAHLLNWSMPLVLSVTLLFQHLPVIYIQVTHCYWYYSIYWYWYIYTHNCKRLRIMVLLQNWDIYFNIVLFSKQYIYIHIHISFQKIKKKPHYSFRNI